MSILPDELWMRILEIGVQSRGFTYKDLCCVSIASRRLHRLSNDDSLWSRLLFSDFPFSTSSSMDLSSKVFYALRFERDKERRIAAHKRAILRKESQIVVHSTKLKNLEDRLMEENKTLSAAVAELSNLRSVRQASVALNVWQPEVVRCRQKQIIEQCSVSVESRSHFLEMEVRLCKKQISVLQTAIKFEKGRLESAKDELLSLKYHPIPYEKHKDGSENHPSTAKKCLKRRRKEEHEIS